jgi:uncharacterized FlaG/YvyC family protein
MAKEILVQRDIAKALKAKNLAVPSLPVTVDLTLDEKMLKLIKAGKEGFRVQELSESANDAINEWIPAFQSAIDAVDAKLIKLSADDAAKKVAELNEVLKKSSKLLQSQISKAVEKNWAAAAARDKDLRNYKIGVGVNVGTSLFSASASILSLIATAGADIVSALNLVRVATNLAAVYRREAMDMFEQHKRVATMMDELDATVILNLDGAQNAAKNVAAALSPALGRFLTSTKTTELEIKALRAKYTKSDQQADETVGKINAALDKLNKLTSTGIDQKAYDLIVTLRKNVDEMLDNLVTTRSTIKTNSKELETWQAAIDAWIARKPLRVKSRALGDIAKPIATAGMLAASALKAADAITSLI